jgi:hypothetical protein
MDSASMGEREREREREWSPCVERICKESWMVVLLFEKPGKERKRRSSL